MNATRRIIERRRQELLGRRADAISDACRAATWLRLAAMTVHQAESALAHEGFDEPPVTVDDAAGAIYEDPPGVVIKTQPVAMKLLQAALKQTKR